MKSAHLLGVLKRLWRDCFRVKPKIYPYSPTYLKCNILVTELEYWRLKSFFFVGDIKTFRRSYMHVLNHISTQDRVASSKGSSC